MTLKMILFWLVVGNYAYQFFGNQNWMEAFDRSYFQAIALVGVWFATWMSRRSTKLTSTTCGGATK